MYICKEEGDICLARYTSEEVLVGGGEGRGSEGWGGEGAAGQRESRMTERSHRTRTQQDLYNTYT